MRSLGWKIVILIGFMTTAVGLRADGTVDSPATSARCAFFDMGALQFNGLAPDNYLAVTIPLGHEIYGANVGLAVSVSGCLLPVHCDFLHPRTPIRKDCGRIALQALMALRHPVLK